MELAGSQRRQLIDALVSAFPTPGALKQMLSFRLNLDLETIASGSNYTEVMFSLVRWAESRNRLDELVREALAENPGNRDLQDFVGTLRKQEQYEIKINLPGLLQMLGTNIYADSAVAVREMIQNAHDSCVRRQEEDPASLRSPRIDISFDSKARTIIFQDNGSGLTESEIHKYLSTIGQGYTAELRRALNTNNRSAAQKLIGQFGLGLLSAFSIGEKVRITTCSYQTPDQAHQWECDGDINYTLMPVEVKDVGTKVVIYVNEAGRDLLQTEELRRIIKQYADFLSIPIYLTPSILPINTIFAPWDNEPGAPSYNTYIEQRFDIPPLEIIPVNVDEPDIVIRGVLYVPLKSILSIQEFGEIDVYCSRMFVIGNDRELLPKWAKFVQGVIDTPTLTPSVSRDTIVRNDAYDRVKQCLGEVIFKHLENLAQTNRRRLRGIITNHNTLIKAWGLEEDNFFDRICDLVEFETDAGRMTIPEYRAKLRGEDVIYYFSDIGSGTPQKILFQAKGLPVIDASYGAEEAFLRKYADRKNVEIRKMEVGADFLFEEFSDPDGTWDHLISLYDRRGIEAKVVSFEPVQIPAVLVTRPTPPFIEEFEKLLNRSNIGGDLRRLFDDFKRSQEQQSRHYLTLGATVLYLNAKNSVMQKVQEIELRPDIMELVLIAIYNNAILFESHVITPENAKRMFSTNNSTIEMLITTIGALDGLTVELREARSELERTKQEARPKLYLSRSCFYARPLGEVFSEVQADVQRSLQQTPYQVRIVTTENDPLLDVLERTREQIAASHFFVADITGQDSSVFAQLGMMLTMRRPIILLKDADGPDIVGLEDYPSIDYKRVPISGKTVLVNIREGLEALMPQIFNDMPELETALPWDKTTTH